MTHLHVHSTFSFLEGTATPAQLVARAASCGMPSLALTDTGGLYGAIPFYHAATKAGIKPILGAQLGGLVLLARTLAGYQRLCELVTRFQLGQGEEANEEAREEGRDTPFPGGGVPMDLLDDSLFVLSGDPKRLEALRRQGLRPIAALTLERERTSRSRAEQLRAWAQRKGLRCAAVQPVAFLEPEQHRLHRVLRAIGLNTTVEALQPGQTADPADHFRTPEAMARLYADWPEALHTAEEIAAACNVELSLGIPLFPECSVPAGESPFSQLWQLSYAGIRERYRPLTPEVAQRLQYELDIINRLGFAPYFLIVADIVRQARAWDIPAVGRGSAANSLVAYALGITRADPLKYGLYFERFLNLERGDCPDIDVDLCWRRRDEVVDYVYERYGRDRVAMIASLNTFRARGAVREVAKAFGLSEAEVGRITRRLPHYHASDIPTMVAHIPESRGLPIHEEPLKSIVETAQRIDGFPRHLSMHPCGLVIAPSPLTQFTPLQRAAKGILITQYDMGPIEDLGLVKMDLLGHRSLTVIDDALRLVRNDYGIALDIEALPDPDPLTADLIRTGRTIGCFQIESPAMRALLQHTQADNTDLLIKTLSLVRPGPSGSGMKKHFIDRRLGKEPTEHLHPRLAEVLGDTYGVMLYQEDILKVAHVIAGMSLGEADQLRRAMTKKRSPREMAKSMKVFMEKALGQGVGEAAAERIWEVIANFAKYSYCKAHACTYGEIAYQCTYLKAHYPAAFMACVLANRGGFYHTAVYVEEARRLGVPVRPPCVVHSRADYALEGGAIRTGFASIRGLAQESVRAILAERERRPFAGFVDLCRRTGLPRADAEALIAAGACDAFGQTRPQLRWALEVTFKAGGPPPQEEDRLVEDSGALVPRLPDCPRKLRMDQEWTALGMLVSTHPLEYYAPLLRERTLVLSRDLAHYGGCTVTLAGWLIAERRVGVKERGAMKFLTFEDPAGVFEAVLFPEAYQRYGSLIDSHGPYFVTGEVQDADHYCSIITARLERVDNRPKSPSQSDITPPLEWITGPRAEGE